MEKIDISVLVEKAKYYMRKKEEMQKALDSIRFVMKLINEEPNKQKEDKFNARKNFFVIPSVRVDYKEAIKMIFEKYPISIISVEHIIANLRYLKECTFLIGDEIITTNLVKDYLNSLVKQNILELVNEFDDIHEPLYRLKKRSIKDIVEDHIVTEEKPLKKMGITEAVREYFEERNDRQATRLDVLSYLQFLQNENLLNSESKDLGNSLYQTLKNLCTSYFLKRTSKNNIIYYKKINYEKAEGYNK